MHHPDFIKHQRTSSSFLSPLFSSAAPGKEEEGEEGEKGKGKGGRKGEIKKRKEEEEERKRILWNGQADEARRGVTFPGEADRLRGGDSLATAGLRRHRPRTLLAKTPTRICIGGH